MLEIKENAINRMKELLSNGGSGIRIFASKKGCSGIAFYMECVTDEIDNDDVRIVKDNVTLFIKKDSLIHVLGTSIDYEDDGLNANFRFENPRIRGKCNCGQSFMF